MTQEEMEIQCRLVSAAAGWTYNKEKTTTMEEKPFWGMCPECASDVEFYDTLADKQGGRYRCPSCGRDTTWASARGISGADLIKEIDKKLGIKRGVKDET